MEYFPVLPAAMKAEVIASWCELYALEISGVMKHDVVHVMYWEYYERSDGAVCALVVTCEKEEKVIPNEFLRILTN